MHICSAGAGTSAHTISSAFETDRLDRLAVAREKRTSTTKNSDARGRHSAPQVGSDSSRPSLSHRSERTRLAGHGGRTATVVLAGRHSSVRALTRLPISESLFSLLLPASALLDSLLSHATRAHGAQPPPVGNRLLSLMSRYHAPAAFLCGVSFAALAASRLWLGTRDACSSLGSSGSSTGVAMSTVSERPIQLHARPRCSELAQSCQAAATRLDSASVQHARPARPLPVACRISA